MKTRVPLALVSLGLASSVSAATFEVPAGDVAALKAAIISSAADGDDPDVINLATGSTYTLTTIESDETGLPTLPGGLTINGNGARIERSSAPGIPSFRLMLIDGDLKVVMNDLILANGVSSEEGGAIYSEVGSESLELNRCEIHNNSAAIGGAVYMDFSGEDLIARDTIFEGNSSSSDGGAVYLDVLEAGSFINCTFISNTSTGGNGGALYTEDELVLSRCNLDRNSAPAGRGGAIYLEDDLIVVGGTWTANTALDGGAVFCEGGIDWTDGLLTGNVSTNPNGGGAAIWHLGSEALFEGTEFRNNISPNGGGIYSDGEVRVTDCLFQGNSTERDGAGIFTKDFLLVRNCRFLENLTTTSFGTGAAIFGSAASNISIFDSTFAGNSGNTIDSSGRMEVSDSTFQENVGTIGGAILIQGSTATTTVRRSRFLSNRATLSTGQAGRGGAIAGLSGNLTIDRCYFKSNCADISGGAVDASSTGLIISRSVFIENKAIGTTASSGGGAALISSGSFQVFNSTFSSNHSATRGGALSIGSAMTAVLNSCTIVGNSAAGGEANSGGGGINILFNTPDLGNSIVSGNTSGGTGPDIRGTLDSLGHNLIGDLAGATLNGVTTGNLIGVSPDLAALDDTGTFTSAMIPSPASPVLDAGRADTSASAVFDDQRGFTRPSDLLAVANAAGSDGTDIGAVETVAPDTPQSGSVPLVNTTDGGFDGVCGTNHCSLADALDAARLPGASGVVRFDPTVFTSPSTITLNALLPSVVSDISIEGPGSQLLTIARDPAAPPFRHFEILEGLRVSLSGIALANGIGTPLPGDTNAIGGAILNFGELTLNDVKIIDSSAGFGGGIYNTGKLVIEGSSFLRNTVSSTGNAFGGAIYSQSTEPMIVDDSYFEENGGDHLASNGIDFGGAIYSHLSQGLLTVTSSNFIRNQARGGGAINCRSPIEVYGCEFLENISGISGPAVDSSGATTTVEACYFAQNTSTAFYGAALSVRTNGLIRNSTFSGNVNTERVGGALWSEGTLTVENCTFTGNSALLGDGGAIYLDDGKSRNTIIRHCTIVDNSAKNGGGIRSGNSFRTSLSHTIIAGNSADLQGPDYFQSFNSQGFNLIGTLDGSFSFGATDSNLVGADPALAALADQGGATPTCALTSGSAALNAGNLQFTAPPSIDQRGFPRVSGGRIDIGAYELEPAIPRTFAQWAIDHSLFGLNAATTADPDHDGADNLLEAIVGTDPNDGASIPKPELKQQAVDGKWRASLAKDPTVAAGDLIREVAPGLSSFSVNGAAEVENSASILTIQEIAPEMRQFFRFRAIENPPAP